MSRCRTCHQEYEGKKRGTCNPCWAAYMREYNRRRTPEQRAAEKARKARYYEANKEHVLASTHRNYYANHEERKAQKRHYAAQHREEGRVRWQQWKKDNPERTREYFARYYREHKNVMRCSMASTSITSSH